jgi:hypothetical protein
MVNRFSAGLEVKLVGKERFVDLGVTVPPGTAREEAAESFSYP